MVVIILSIIGMVLLLTVMILLGVVVRMKIRAKRTIMGRSTATVMYARGNPGISYEAFNDSIPTASKEKDIPVSHNEAYGVPRGGQEPKNTPLNEYTSMCAARLLDYTDEDELYI